MVAGGSPEAETLIITRYSDRFAVGGDMANRAVFAIRIHNW